jgi:hypothetical protein
MRRASRHTRDRHLVQEVGVHHIDLNFGCPVRKVTSRGGGSALPLRPRLLRRLVAAAVAAAGPDVPVTVKLRMGLTPELLTFQQVRVGVRGNGVLVLSCGGLGREGDRQHTRSTPAACLTRVRTRAHAHHGPWRCCVRRA